MLSLCSLSVLSLIYSLLSTTYVDGLPPHDDKLLGTLHQEARELLGEDVLNIVGLLNQNAHAHRVDRRLDQAHLDLRAAEFDRVQDQLPPAPHLHLRLVVPLHHL